MRTTSKIDNLSQKITLLKHKQEYDLEILKTHFHYTYESLKPVNLIKKIVHDVVSSSEIKTDVLKGVINYFSNKVFPEKNNNFIIKTINFVISELTNKK
ncbi:hypothetical protein [Flavobacterium sp.]|uniref:hypothetical protein n=1 Tax=Flavobacterium sp. TaxID=239 RepID=UPI00286DBF07|nr:hypothetical protein [Flavobacterium sp.]